jgi:hypothetical protein
MLSSLNRWVTSALRSARLDATTSMGRRILSCRVANTRLEHIGVARNRKIEIGVADPMLHLDENHGRAGLRATDDVGRAA